MLRCIVKIEGITLPAKTLIQSKDVVLTNDIEYPLPTLLDKGYFIMHFGYNEFNTFGNNAFFICDFPNEKDSNVHFITRNISDIIHQIWRIKDNSIYAKEFFFITQKPRKYFRCGLSSNFNSTSDGIVKSITINSDEFNKMFDLWYQVHPFLSGKAPNIDKHYINNREITISSHKLIYNGQTKIDRALSFLKNARNEVLLPLKITNYIAFLECLFCIEHRNISHRVSERVATFIKKYDNIDNTGNVDDILTCIKTCYNIRSKYIHGDFLKDENSDYIGQQLNSQLIDSICRRTFNLIITNSLFIFNDDKKKLGKYFQDLEDLEDLED